MKTSFVARGKEAEKSLKNKAAVNNALVFWNKNRENNKKLETFELGCSHGKNHFENDGTQNSLVFQPVYKHFK